MKIRGYGFDSWTDCKWVRDLGTPSSLMFGRGGMSAVDVLGSSELTRALATPMDEFFLSVGGVGCGQALEISNKRKRLARIVQELAAVRTIGEQFRRKGVNLILVQYDAYPKTPKSTAFNALAPVLNAFLLSVVPGVCAADFPGVLPEQPKYFTDDGFHASDGYGQPLLTTYMQREYPL